VNGFEELNMQLNLALLSPKSGVWLLATGH